MFKDPDTGLPLTKAALADAFSAVTHFMIWHKYKISIPLAKIRSQWSLHSFRITGQNLLRVANAPIWLIKQAGRWLSDAVFEYDRQTVDRLACLTAQMSNTTAYDLSPSLSIPGLESYPYPAHTLHSDIEDRPEALAKRGVGPYTLSSDPSTMAESSDVPAPLPMSDAERNLARELARLAF